MFTIVSERPSDAGSIQNLYQAAFGPGRRARTAERLRETNVPVSRLCFIAQEDGALVGSVRFWPIAAGATPGLLLGPLAVQPYRQRNGMGVALMEAGITQAILMRVAFVLLVGDEPYYQRVGFKCAEGARFHMPGPVDAHRLLVRELSEGGAGAGGRVIAAPIYHFPN